MSFFPNADRGISICAEGKTEMPEIMVGVRGIMAKNEFHDGSIAGLYRLLYPEYSLMLPVDCPSLVDCPSYFRVAVMGIADLVASLLKGSL